MARAQATGGTAKSGYKKLRPERVQITSAIKKAGTYRGNAGRKPKSTYQKKTGKP